jgi:glucokinase
VQSPSPTLGAGADDDGGATVTPVTDGSAIVGALDIGGSKVAAAVSDLEGTRLATASVPTQRHQGARDVLGRSIELLRALLSPYATRLAAVGVATIGVPRAGHIDLAETIGGWGGIALAAEVGDAFGVEVAAVNDVKAAARAEARWGALLDADPGLYVNLGTGLGAALVVGGRVLEGAHNAAGEIGYSLRSMDDVGLTARRTLEDAASGRSFAEDAVRLGAPASAAGLFGVAASDPAASEATAHAVAELSFHVVNLAIALDPSRIAVGGGLTGSWASFEGPLRAGLEAAVPFPPKLVLARFAEDAALVGALALATELVTRR